VSELSDILELPTHAVTSIVSRGSVMNDLRDCALYRIHVDIMLNISWVLVGVHF